MLNVHLVPQKTGHRHGFDIQNAEGKSRRILTKSEADRGKWIKKIRKVLRRLRSRKPSAKLERQVVGSHTVHWREDLHTPALVHVFPEAGSRTAGGQPILRSLARGLRSLTPSGIHVPRTVCSSVMRSARSCDTATAAANTAWRPESPERKRACSISSDVVFGGGVLAASNHPPIVMYRLNGALLPTESRNGQAALSHTVQRQEDDEHMPAPFAAFSEAGSRTPSADPISRSMARADKFSAADRRTFSSNLVPQRVGSATLCGGLAGVGAAAFTISVSDSPSMSPGAQRKNKDNEGGVGKAPVCP